MDLKKGKFQGILGIHGAVLAGRNKLNNLGKPGAPKNGKNGFIPFISGQIDPIFYKVGSRREQSFSPGILMGSWGCPEGNSGMCRAQGMWRTLPTEEIAQGWHWTKFQLEMAISRSIPVTRGKKTLGFKIPAKTTWKILESQTFQWMNPKIPSRRCGVKWS